MEITSTIHNATKDQLKALVERIERLEEEKAAIANDIKEIYAEAKGNGFDTKALRKIISLRKKAEHERLEEEAILATYMHALGLIPDLDGGRAMIGHNSSAGQVDLEEAIERAA